MADINLLGTNNQGFNFARTGASWAVKILAAVLVLVLLYYGFLRLQISRTNGAIRDTQAKTSQLEADVLTGKNRGEVITRQGQVQNLNTLIKSHVYWSGLLPELAHVTLKSASYAGFTADTAGTLNLDIIVPNYAEADKYIQVFDLPQFNQQFSDVKILSISKIQTGSTVQTEMKLQLKFNPQFIRKTLQ
jgi:hypothetical protein